MLILTEANTNREIGKFIEMPHSMYKGDPNYVPALFTAQKAMFNKQKYPFFKHSSIRFMLLKEQNEIIGRMALIRNDKHNQFSGDHCGFFGFFEVINNYIAAEFMFNHAVAWAKKQGFNKLVGPENFTTNDSVGFLVDGFDDPPTIMMPYNKPYYKQYFEKYGFQKLIDLSAYKIPSNHTPINLQRIADICQKRVEKSDITIRPINLKAFKTEINKFRNVYNNSYANNWGFVPLSEEEFEYQANELKKIADPKMILLVEKQGQMIGFICAIPDINQVLITVRKGRLFPSGILKLLLNQKKINRVRIMILGIQDAYRNLGIDAILYSKIFERCREIGYTTAEAAYVMDNNVKMNTILQKIGAGVSKQYRLYTYNLSSV